MLRAGPDQLFARFRAHGDAVALARVFDRTAPKLLSVARHLARDAAEAEDLVQATFVTAIERASSFDPARELMPWLVGILAKEAAAARRRAGRTRALVSQAANTPELGRTHDRDGDPAEEVERRELCTAVDAAVAELPPLYRPVLSAYLAGGEPPEEIARRLGRTPGAVRVQVHRGLALLRKALPAGFASGAAVVAVPTRGLAAVKHIVLQHVPAYTAAAAVGVGAGGAGILGGALLMGKHVVLGACAALLALGAAWFVFEGGVPRPARPEPQRSVGSDPGAAAVQPAPGARERELGAALAPVPTDERVELAPATRPSASAADTRRSFALSGSVVDAFDGHVLAGAALSLRGRTSDGRWVTRSERTGSDGRFDLAGLDFAPLGLDVSLAGYSTHGVFPWREALAQSLAAGRDFDVGTIELRPGAVVRGRVLSARGEGLGDVELYLVYHHLGELPAGRPPEGYATWAARSGPDGRFELRGRLAYGGEATSEYVLVAVSEQGMGWRGFQLLRGQGDSVELEIRLQAGAQLELVVLDTDGRAVPGARVRALPRFEPFAGIGAPEDGFWPGGGARLDELTARVTDADGHARFAGLPLWQGGSPPSPEPAEPAGDGGDEYDLEVRTDGAPWRERVHLVPGANLHTLALGALEPRVLAGRVRDTDGRPLAGASVSALGREVRTFTDGSFRLDGLLEQSPTTLVTAELDGWSRARAEVVWGERLLVEDVEMELGRPAAIAGVVTDDAGRPVAGARLYLERESRNAHDTRLTAESDAEGRFEFAQAWAGAWYLNVWPPAPADELGGWGGVVTQRVQGGERALAVVLQRRPAGVARLVAQVVDAASGLALDPEHVRLLPRIELASGEVPVAPNPRREAGRVVVDGLRPGRWRVWVRAAGREPGHADFEVHPGEREVRTEVRLGGSATLVGRVELADDVDPEHARVSVTLANWQSAVAVGEEWSTAAQHRGLVTPGSDGAFRVEHLLPGRYVVTLHHFAMMAEEELELAPDSEAQVLLHPEPGAVLILSGRVPPSAASWVFLELEQAPGWRSGTLWAQIEQGRFEYRVLAPPGRIEWRASWNATGELGREPEASSQGVLVAEAGREHRITVSWR